VSIEVDINNGKSRERWGIEMRSNSCESLRGDEDKNGTLNSMVIGLFLAVLYSKGLLTPIFFLKA
jgi:hypothetical protein